MENQEFQEKVLDFISRTDEKLKTVITKPECEIHRVSMVAERNKVILSVHRIYWICFGAASILGIIAKVKGIIWVINQ